MCMFSQPSAPPPVTIPKAPEAPAAPPPAAQESDQQVQQARGAERQKRLRAANQNSTLITGGAGLNEPASTGLKTAFGA